MIDVRRFTEEEKNTIHKFQDIFGKDMHKHMIVLFSRGDNLEYDNKTIESYIREAGPNLGSLISSCGVRYHVFNNREREDRTQLKELFQKVYSMLSLNNYMYYSYKLFTIANSKSDKNRILEELEEKLRQLQNKNDCHLL